MKPVEVSIMHKQHNRECCKKIKPSVSRNIRIISSVFTNGIYFQHYNRRKSKDHNANYRENNFTYIVFSSYKTQLDFLKKYFLFQEHIKYNKCNAGNDKIISGITNKNVNYIIPVHVLNRFTKNTFLT